MALSSSYSFSSSTPPILLLNLRFLLFFYPTCGSLGRYLGERIQLNSQKKKKKKEEEEEEEDNPL
jgi:hypothetical protein